MCIRDSLTDSGIVRHRGKIEAAINNARAARELIQKEGTLTDYVWRFLPPESERPRTMDYAALRTLGTTAASNRLSRDLKQRGFRFVGPTTASVSYTHLDVYKRQAMRSPA